MVILTFLKDICRDADVLFCICRKIENMHKWWIFGHNLPQDIKICIIIHGIIVEQKRYNDGIKGDI